MVGGGNVDITLDSLGGACRSFACLTTRASFAATARVVTTRFFIPTFLTRLHLMLYLTGSVFMPRTLAGPNLHEKNSFDLYV